MPNESNPLPPVNGAFSNEDFTKAWLTPQELDFIRQLRAYTRITVERTVLDALATIDRAGVEVYRENARVLYDLDTVAKPAEST